MLEILTWYIIGALLIGYFTLNIMIHEPGFSEEDFDNWKWWLPVIVSMLLWPVAVLVAFLDALL